ncbi:hypothetical protein JAO10_01045 [Burkholderia contaminans]|uniref:hypothetical protein n=1 Tax=Burkholderia contaminans TaxID=488447 RepID=UPI0018DD1CEA|nr:hypothetical protein [Burkholderia contaminans]MBH9718902.1 hypothetical protein [Burkholderia contaminans]
MTKKLWDVAPEIGITRIWHYDESNDTATIESVQDHGLIIESNKDNFNAVDERAKWGDGMTKVASIPLVILEDLQRKGITKDPIAFRKWLNDPENRFFRTRPGKV